MLALMSKSIADDKLSCEWREKMSLSINRQSQSERHWTKTKNRSEKTETNGFYNVIWCSNGFQCFGCNLNWIWRHWNFFCCCRLRKRSFTINRMKTKGGKIVRFNKGRFTRAQTKNKEKKSPDFWKWFDSKLTITERWKNIRKKSERWKCKIIFRLAFLFVRLSAWISAVCVNFPVAYFWTSIWTTASFSWHFVADATAVDVTVTISVCSCRRQFSFLFFPLHKNVFPKYCNRSSARADAATQSQIH